MNKKNIMKRTKVPSKIMNIRISVALSEWMHKNKYSPTGIFREAVKDLGWKDD